MRIYGDGSAGALIVPDNAHLQLYSIADVGNLQFSSISIGVGASLEVWSGTVLRCTGACNIAGTIKVDPLSLSGGGRDTGRGDTDPPGANIFGQTAGNGEFDFSNTHELKGGSGALGNPDELSMVTMPGPVGGGGGAASDSDISMGGSMGGDGGGTLVILAADAVHFGSAGQITANGDPGYGGGGGGAGGIIIIASAKSIVADEFAGSGYHYHAHGGAGDRGSTQSGPGGGGGGGFVRFISPVNTNIGAVDVAGGSAGAVSGSVSQTPRMGGGGGGGCAGDGGRGGGIPPGATVTSQAASPGTSGSRIVTTANPAALFY